MFYERTIENTLRNISDSFPVMLLTGPRQIGKTTLLTKMAGGNRRIVSLDSPAAQGNRIRNSLDAHDF